MFKKFWNAIKKLWKVMLKIGNKLVKKIFLGSTEVKEVYVGNVKVYPNVASQESGYNYGEWSYNDPTRTRTKQYWERDVYADGTKSAIRYGATETETETATISTNMPRIVGTCNAAGVENAYDCDGTYTVSYNRMYYSKSYNYSDVTHVEEGYGVGEVASREQVEGQCGYAAPAIEKTDVTVGIYETVAEGVYIELSEAIDEDLEIVVDNSDISDREYTIPAGQTRIHYTMTCVQGTMLSILSITPETTDLYNITIDSYNASVTCTMAHSGSGSSGGKKQ